MEVEFKYKFSSNLIKFKLIEADNEIWMEDINIDYEHPKVFFLLLRNAFDKFIGDGYKIFVQTIMRDEWELIKNNDWEIKNDSNESPVIIIKCNIEHALINIAKGLGFND